MHLRGHVNEGWRRGDNISVDLYLLVLLHNTNFMNNLNSLFF